MEERSNENITPEELAQRAKMFEFLKKFFKSDMRIKETLLKLAPTELDDTNEETRKEYTDRLYKELKEIELEFNDIAQNFRFGSEISKSIKKHFDKAKDKFLISHFEKGVIHKLYKEQFWNMDEKFIDEVKEQCIGYTMFGADLEKLINESGTINELLHVMHSYISNDELILQAMPIIDTKQNEEDYPITLYGDENEISRSIFENFPLDLTCGWSEIVSMQGKILMMIRDRGHALTIDIDTVKENDIFVKYFIPKLCNRNMIEALPGINKKSITQNGATGIFRTTKEKVSKDIFEFIEKVPTDYDIPIVQETVRKMEEEIIKQDTSKVAPLHIFEKEDAKELALEQGEKGRCIGSVMNLKKALKNAINKLRVRNTEKDFQDLGGDTNERADRDL